MAEDFCTRTARRIRRLGYPAKRAAWLARVCYLLMLSLCGLFASVLFPALKSLTAILCGNDPRTAAGALPSGTHAGCRHGPAACGGRVAGRYLFSAIHRRLPAC